MLSRIMHVLHFNSIKGNVILSLIAMGAFTLLLSATSYWVSHHLEKNYRAHTKQIEPAKATLHALNADLQGAILHLNAFLETGKDQHRVDWEKLWRQSITAHKNKLSGIDSHTVNKDFTENLLHLNQKIDQTYNFQQELMQKLQEGYLTAAFKQAPNESSPALLQEYRLASIEVLLPQLNGVHTSIEKALTDLDLQSRQLQEHQQEVLSKLKTITLVICILGLTAGILIAYFLISQIIRSLYYIKLAVKDLGKGNLPEVIRQSQNETSHITKELATLTQNLRNVQQFALKVGEGKFENEINVFNNSGDLGSSLASMRESLYGVAQEDQQRNWVNEGFAQFADSMRNHNTSIGELCDNTISSLVKYVGANQGAIFLVKEGEQEGSEVLQMASCYAYDRKKYLSKEILKGEGICGQAWQEHDILLLNDVPQNFMQIRSGLGGATPKAVLAVPLVAQDQVQGVLELASFQQFEQYQVGFISKISENLASAIATAITNEKTQLLLVEFQHITEQLRAHEEEMRQNMEELEATQEEMERAQKEIARKEYNLNSVINNTQDTIFAIDQEYRITVVNKVLSDKYAKMGISLEPGTFIKSVLPPAAWEKWKARYDRALAGEQYSIIEESTGSAGSRFSQTYHNPILDDDGNIVGVSVISRDVTDTVTAQQEAERKRSTLNSLIDNTDDTYFAIDKGYKILIANKTLKDRYAASNVSLLEGDNIFDKLPKEQHSLWKERYDRALAGESFILTTTRQVRENILTIEVHHNPILDAEGKVIGASVVSKDITRWQQTLQENEAHALDLEKLKQAMGLESSAQAQVLKRNSPQRFNEKTK